MICGDWGRSRFVRHEGLALLAFIQGVALHDGACDTWLPTLRLARRQGQRAHHQTALLLGVGLPGMIHRAAFARGGKAGRHWIGRPLERTVGGGQAERAGRKGTTPDGGEHAGTGRFRHLFGRERAQGGIAVGHNLHVYPEGRHLTVADVGQPATPGDLADFGNLRQIQRVISHSASHHRGRQRPAERIVYCQAIYTCGRAGQ